MEALFFVLIVVVIAWNLLAKKSVAHLRKTVAVRLPVVSDAGVPPSESKGKTWSGKPTGPFAIKSLTRQQSDCLQELSAGLPLTPDGRGGFLYRGQSLWLYNLRTVNSLLKHGMLEADASGAVHITDHGLHALEALPQRY